MLMNLDRAMSAAEKKIRKATIIAINRAGKYAINQGIKKVQERYKIKTADFKALMKELRAGRDETYIMRIKGKGRPVPASIVRKTKTGVQIRHKGYIQNIPHAFINTSKRFTSGGQNGEKASFVFIRKGKSRYPIKRVYDAEVKRLITSDAAMEMISKSFKSQYKKEYIRAMQYAK